ncbi:putative mitochondrial LSU ribosomal protein L33 precursor [Triangularia setosa]|uniref:Large ribosomal subunit protein uL30m n=1 Tax=Triangularia setosa TaxID=2587417 RepID=A0AAN6W595_9PEZI|nr:putative mitochondrial LSU ribosomal protein L33 precursor [Podospora setosa]
MSYFRITLHRSAIGLPQRTRAVLAALGLHKRSQTVYHPVEAQFAGMIMKVKELVKVQEVDKKLTKWEVQAERRPDSGFYLEKMAPRMEDEGQKMGGRVLARLRGEPEESKVVEGLTRENGGEVRI